MSAANENDDLRFGFGKNWADFIEKHFSEDALEQSRDHLAGFLRIDSLKGLTFLDIGCGSGLHSLAAWRLGAERIVSFDFDKESVATTERIRQGVGAPDNWTVIQGSVLDQTFMASLPKSDIVYSWGVLHHTGDMWSAVRNATTAMKPDGIYYIALYSADNYVNPPPEYWLKIKRDYNRAGSFGKRIMEWRYLMRFQILPQLRAGRLPMQMFGKYGMRGMTFWTDVRDWLGGYPMDFASFADTQSFGIKELGLDLVNVKTGEGCTEYLFCCLAENGYWREINDRRTRMPLLPPFAHLDGHSYSCTLPGLAEQSDTAETPRRSRLMLFEDGRMLGLSHSLHSDIVRYGKGRFSHWADKVLFASSDGSDPNTNRKSYIYCDAF
jgi:SAM-dependent methyltransferase